MAKFKRPEGGGGGGKRKEGSIVAGNGKHQKIIEGRCNTCKHEERDRIDYMLAMRTPYSEIHRLYPVLSEKSIEGHAKKHLSFEDEGIKRIIEHEAGLARENLADGLHGVFMRRTVLDMAIKRLVDGIASGEVALEAKDLPKLVEIREKMDADTSATQVEQYELQFNAFKSAMEEICPPEILFQILNRTKELLKVGDKPALQSGD